MSRNHVSHARRIDGCESGAYESVSSGIMTISDTYRALNQNSVQENCAQRPCSFREPQRTGMRCVPARYPEPISVGRSNVSSV